jgi:hypothetical protein
MAEIWTNVAAGYDLIYTFLVMAYLKKLGPKKIFWLGLLIILIIFFISSPGRVAIKTGLITAQVIPDFPIKPLKLFTKEPIVAEVKSTKGSTKFVADIYRPADEGTHQAAIFILGSLATRENPLVVEIADSLARLGFVIFVPEEPELAAGHVSNTAIDYYVEVFEYLYEQPFVDKGGVGFGGFCVGGSVAIKASEDPRIADEVAFVHAISPYYNLENLSREIITGKYVQDGEKIDWDPADLSEDTLKRGVVLYFTDSQDRQILEEKIFEKESSGSDVSSELSKEGQAALTYMQTQDFDESEKLYDLVWPKGMKQYNADLSPSTNIEDLKAKLFIISDTNDMFVPPYHSQKFVENLPKGQVYHSEIDAFEHVKPGNRLKLLRGFRQAGKLFNHLWQFFNFVG